jgi:hypothetical protein
MNAQSDIQENAVKMRLTRRRLLNVAEYIEDFVRRNP